MVVFFSSFLCLFATEHTFLLAKTNTSSVLLMFISTEIRKTCIKRKSKCPSH